MEEGLGLVFGEWLPVNHDRVFGQVLASEEVRLSVEIDATGRFRDFARVADTDVNRLGLVVLMLAWRWITAQISLFSAQWHVSIGESKKSESF